MPKWVAEAKAKKKKEQETAQKKAQSPSVTKANNVSKGSTFLGGGSAVKKTEQRTSRTTTVRKPSSTAQRTPARSTTPQRATDTGTGSRSTRTSRMTDAQYQKTYGQPRRTAETIRREKEREERRLAAQRQKSGLNDLPTAAQRAATDRALKNTLPIAKESAKGAAYGHLTTLNDIASIKSQGNGKSREEIYDPNLAEKSRQQAEQRVKKYQAKTQDTEDAIQKLTKNAKGLEKAYYGAVESGTGMLTDIGIGALTGTGQVGSLAAMFSRTYGSTRGKAQKEGATEAEDRAYAAAQAAKEVGTELMFPGAGLARGYAGKQGLKLADTAANILTKNLRGRAADLGGAGVRLLGGVLEENAEELAGWGLDPLIKEITYGKNARTRNAQQAMKERSNALRAEIQNEDDARAAAAYLSSDDFFEQTVNAYREAGLSKKDAEEVADRMRDYLTASLTGDTDSMEQIEDEVSKKVAGTKKLEWDFDELKDTIASTTLLTAATGLPGTGMTAVKGAALRDQLGDDGVRALTNTAIDFEDSEMSLKAKAMKARLDSGNELTSTQVYDLQVGMQEQIRKDTQREESSRRMADKRIKSDNLLTPYRQNENGGIDLDEATEASYREHVSRANEIIDGLTSETKESLTANEKVDGSKAIAGFQTGVFTIEDANTLNYSNTTVRAAFEEATGVDLGQYVVKNKDGSVNIPATNTKTKDALFAMAADNLVKSAQAETANWMDNAKGQVVTQVSARMGAQGSAVLQQALDDVDERDRSKYMMTANATDMLYQAARNMGTEWESIAPEATRMFPGISESKLKIMYEAGLADREMANDKARGRQVRMGQALTEMGEQETATGKVFIDTEVPVKGSVIRTFTEITKNLGADIHFVDYIYDAENNPIAGANGSYDPNTNTFYLNVATGAETNIGYIFMHETTHYLKTYAPEQYQALENLVRERWFAFNPSQMQDAIARKIEAYKRATKGQQVLTEEQALEEIIADASHDFINDPEFARQVAEEDMGLAKAVLDSIRNALRMLRRIFASGSIDDDTHMNSLFRELDIMAEAEKLWLDAYKVAVQNSAINAVNEWQDNVNAQSSLSVSDGYTIQDGNARWTDERIDDLIERYGAKGSENYSQAYAVLMNPRDFLHITIEDELLRKWRESAANQPEGLSYKESQRAVWDKSYLEGKLLDDQNFPLDEAELRGQTQTPFLYIRSYKSGQRVLGHEGRHRMRALMEAGVTSVPVVIEDPDTKTSKQNVDSMILGYQEDVYNGAGIVRVNDLVPIRESNRDELIQKFGGEAQVRFSVSEDAMTAEMEAADARYSIVEDPQIIKHLEADSHVTTYRAMAQIDGKLYPPMSTQVRDENGNWALQQGIEIGQWVESDATTDSKMFNSKGQYLLRKDNGKTVPAAYNPYIHSSDTMLNDQFASAYQRPNLVVVEGEIPESELSNGIPAETTLDDGRVIKAKDAPGVVNWKAGVVQGKLTGTRTVYLTNHFKPTRVVPDSEVAENIRDMVADADVAIPYNVVTPSVREELLSLGVKMEQSSNKNYQVRLSLEDKAYDELNEEEQRVIHEAVSPDIRFSMPTERDVLPKARYKSDIGFSNAISAISGKQARINALKKNGFSEKQAEQIGEAISNFILDTGNWIEGDLQSEFTFVGWDDLINAEVSVRKDWKGKVVGVSVSAMVANGEYPVNFDLTTICNKREGIMQVIQELTRVQTDTGKSVLDSVKLTDQDMWNINKALKAEGIDTACLGCFVEARRYYTNRFIASIDNKWNTAVRETRRQLGLPEEEYFNFAHGKKVTGEDYTAISDLWTSYEKSKDTKKSPEQRIRILMNEIIKNNEVDSPYLKLVSASDILTPEGISGLKQISTGKHDLVKTLKSIYGTSAPKEILAFTPYNSEIALLPARLKGQKTDKYLKSIGGIRIQSFSDFKIEHVIDHMQMVADMAARKFTCHAYSKVIAFPRIFGLTGQKINMSVMFDITPAEEWQKMLGCSEEKAKEYAFKYAGLRFVQEKPAENPDNRPYIETEIEGVHGYLTYLLGDADYINSVYEEEYQKNIAAGMDENEARRRANEAKPFEQSINYREAVELENQDGYKENVGIIAVAYGNEHLKILLADPNVRYVIPYHKSGLPVFVSEKTSLQYARNYEPVQNTKKADPAEKLQERYYAFKKGYKGEYPAIAFFGDIYDNGGSIATTEATATEAAKLHGTGEFDVYKDLDKAKDIKEVSNAYLEDCIENNLVPVFSEFAGDPNYYKMLFDFAVTDGTSDHIYPQKIVRNNYPGIDIDAKIAAGEKATDNDYAKLREAIRKGASEENAKNQTRSENMQNVLDDILSKDSENSILAGTNVNAIRDSATDYTNPKGVMYSITPEMDEAYMDAYWDGDDDAMQELVDEAANRAGYTYKAYHHTEFAFTVFDRSKARRSMDIQGFYFSADPEAESEYGSVRYDVFLKIENPYIVNSSESMKALPFDFGTDDAGVRAREWLQENGYDAVIRDAEYYGAEADEIIVFESGQIKSSEPMVFEDDPNAEYGEGDVIPLSQRFDPNNPDIRYSLPTQDSDGNILTNGQIEFFKNSQARDSQGRLVPVYHTTNKGGFTVFDPMKSDDHRSLFFADDWDTSQTYGNYANSRFYYFDIDNIDDVKKYLDAYSPDRYFVTQEQFDQAGGWEADMLDFENVTNGEQSDFANYLDNPDGYIAIIGVPDYSPDNTSYADTWVMAKSPDELVRELHNHFGWQRENYRMGTQHGYYACYLNLEDPYIIDAHGDNWNEIHLDDYDDNVTFDTREIAEMAMDMDFDGVIIRNLVDHGGMSPYDGMFDYSDIYIAFSSNQVKDINNENPTENPDIRYSFSDEDDLYSYMASVAADSMTNEELAYYERIAETEEKHNDYLGKMRKWSEEKISEFYESLVSNDEMPSENEKTEEGRIRMSKAREDFFNSLDAKWNDKWLSNGEVLDLKSVKPRIKQLIMAQMRGANATRQYKTEVLNRTLFDVRTAYMMAKRGRIEVADEIIWNSARNMIANLEFVEERADYETFKEIRDFVKGHRIQIDEGDFPSHDHYKEFLKSNFGRMTLVKDGTGVNQVWQALNEKYGNLFPEEVVSPLNQLEWIADYLNSYEPIRWAYSSEQAAALAFDIADELGNIVFGYGKPIESLADHYKSKYEEKAKALKARCEEAERELRKTRRENESNEAKIARLQEKNQRIEKKLANEKQKAKDKAAKKKDVKERARYTGRIQKNYDWLTKRLLQPTKDKNIPEGFRKDLARLLCMFDLQTERSKELEQKYGIPSQKTFKMWDLHSKLCNVMNEDNGGIFQTNAYIEFLSENLAKRIDGKSIDSLETPDLLAVDEYLKIIVHQFREYDKVRVGEKRVKLEDLGGKVIQESDDRVSKRGQSKEYGGLIKALDSVVNFAELTPIHFFQRMGTMYTMYKEVRKSFDKYIRNEKYLLNKIQNICGEYYTQKKNRPGSELEAWRDSRSAQELRLKNGTVTMTVAQMMSLYCLSKRNQALLHMTKDGIVITPITEGAKIEKARADIKGRKEQIHSIQLTLADIDLINTKLTPDQMKIADKLQELMSGEMAEWGNEMSMKLYGIRMFKEKDYFPIKVSSRVTEQNLDDIDITETIKNFGFTKPTQPNARNAIEVDDIFKVVADHCNNMNLYNAYGESISDFWRVFNYKQYSDEGKPTKTVQQALEEAYGKKAIKYIKNFIKDINGNVAGKRSGGLEEALNATLGKAKKAAVFGNMRVALQQPTAIVRAFAVLNPKYIGAIRVHKGAMQEMFEHCPIAQWKSWGFYDTYMGRDIEDVMMNKWSMSDTALSGIYGQLDNITWTAIWQMCKAEVKDTHPNVKEGTQEFWDLCNERASEVFDKTQVVDSPFHRSDAMRSKDVMVKSLTSFQSEPTLTFNVVRSGFADAADALRNGNKAEFTKKIAGTVAVFVAQAAVVSATAAIWDAVRRKNPDGGDDDDKKWVEFWTMNFFNNLKDNINLLNNIYLVKEIMPYIDKAFFGGYGASNNLLFQSLDTLTNGITQFQKKLEKGDAYDKSWYDVLTNLFGGFGYMFGIPVKTLMKDFKGITSWLGINVLAADEESLMDSVAEKMGYKPIEKTTESKWFDYERNPLKVTDGSTFDNILNHFGWNLTEREKEQIAADEAAKAQAAKADEIAGKVADLTGEAKDKKVWSYVTSYMKGENGDKPLADVIQEGDYKKVQEYRDMYVAAGGNTDYFDERIFATSKSAMKKTIVYDPTDAQIEAQDNIKNYLLTHGMSDYELSEMAYKSNTAKDMKIAFMINDKDAMLETLEPLVRAGLSYEDLERIWDNRNRIDVMKYKNSKGRYADRLKSTGKFIWPTNGSITSYFGYRNAPTRGASSNHPAIDIGAPMGAEVVASDGGVVISTGWNGGYGNSVGIRHDNGMVTYYNHLSAWNVKEGDTVAQGQPIANVGSTGVSTGPHLDFKVLDANGKPVDPLKYLASRS